jgi:hypothetical protein
MIWATSFAMAASSASAACMRREQLRDTALFDRQGLIGNAAVGLR